MICLTPSNLHADWILFEARALSKTLQNTFVCPLLIGLEPSDINGPLAQFQATKVTREGILKLLKTLNTGLAESALPDSHIEEAFEVWWPKLEGELKKLPKDEDLPRPQRTERDLLEEVLSLVRNQNRTLTPEAVRGESRSNVSHKFGTIARTLDPNIQRWIVREKANGYEIAAFNESRKKYRLVLPLGLSDGEFEARVISGLTEHSQPPDES